MSVTFYTSGVLPRAWHQINSISDETAVSGLSATHMQQLTLTELHLKVDVNEYRLCRHISVKKSDNNVTEMTFTYIFD